MHVGFGTVSGLAVQGYKACSSCGPDLEDVAIYSYEMNKVVFLGHTKYLPEGHAMRSDPFLYSNWEGLVEDMRPIPSRKSATFWKERWERIQRGEVNRFRSGINRLSIFHELPYWRELKITHLLDPMHIEGNVGRSLIRHMYGDGHANWKEACKELSMHFEVLPYRGENGQMVNPRPPWCFTLLERREFRQRIGAMRFPTGYGANLRRAFGPNDPTNWPAFLKTHDYHRLIHHIMPVAIIGLGNPALQDAIWSLGKLMRWVCGKEIKISEIEQMTEYAVEVVCKLELALPPSFFDSQIHLLVHLVPEVAIAGPVHCRWMYWLERYMFTMKQLVKNRARVEGNIAERYLAMESMFYCSHILSTIDPNCPRGYVEPISEDEDRLTGAKVCDIHLLAFFMAFIDIFYTVYMHYCSYKYYILFLMNGGFNRDLVDSPLWNGDK